MIQTIERWIGRRNVGQMRSGWRTRAALLMHLVRPTTCCGARSTSLWIIGSLFWQLSGDGSLHGSGLSHATTACSKPSFEAPWRVVDAMVRRENAGRTTSKSGHLCPCQNFSQGPPAEETGRGSLLNRPSSPPDDPIGQGTELN